MSTKTAEPNLTVVTSASQDEARIIAFDKTNQALELLKEQFGDSLGEDAREWFAAELGEIETANFCSGCSFPRWNAIPCQICSLGIPDALMDLGGEVKSGSYIVTLLDLEKRNHALLVARAEMIQNWFENWMNVYHAGRLLVDITMAESLASMRARTGSAQARAEDSALAA
jgi:hypothetical protein